MPDFALRPRSGLDHVMRPGTHGADADEPGIVIALRTDLALAFVMMRKGKIDELRHRAQDRFGTALPLTARRGAAADDGGHAEGGNLRFIWAGPGRWLAATSEQAAPALEATLRRQLSGLASIINQTDGRCVFSVAGPRAREVLSQNLPIDIDPRVFGPGDTALTLAGHINIHFWQLDLTPVYEFAVPRSFAASFYEWLFTRAAKYGVLVRTV